MIKSNVQAQFRGLLILSLTLFLGLGCKTSSTHQKVPFSVEEKTCFQWVGGKPGSRGMTIKITGFSQTTNLSFSKIYFRNREFEVVPQFNGNDFVLEATVTEFSQPDLVMSKDPLDEYGNKPPEKKKDIPFELEDDQAVIQYAVSGRESYHKISGVKQLETVYRP